jgi:rRNA maturation protein Rpf1
MVDTKNPSDIIFYDLDKNPEDLKSFIKYISTIKFDKKGELLEKIKDFIQKKVNEGKTSEEKPKKFKELFAVDSEEITI